MRTLHRTCIGILLCAAALNASAVLINFDDQGLTGPSTFGGPGDDFTLTNVGGSGIDVSFAGGDLLTNTANLPADTSSVYGTADFGSGLLNPLTITFSQAITNLFLDVFNGNTVPNSFEVADNAGNSAVFLLPSNTAGGRTQIGFAAAGTVVTITGLVPVGGAVWDFFADNIHFNEPLPAPEPTSLALLGLGIVGSGIARRRRN